MQSNEILAPEQSETTVSSPAPAEENSSMWSSWTASASASFKQALETTGEALEMTGGILSSVATNATDERETSESGMVVSDEEGSDGGCDEGQASEVPVGDGLLKNLNLGWSFSSVRSSVVEQTKASLKQAESLVDKSFETFQQADDFRASVVKKTKDSLLNSVVDSGDGWSEENPLDDDLEKTEPDGESDKNDVVVEFLGDQDANDNDNDLFDFR